MGKTEVKSEKVEVKVVEEITEICEASIEANPGLALGLANLKKIKVNAGSNWPVVPFSEFELGTIGFRSSYGDGVKIAVAGGQAQQRHFALPHYIAMVEGMGNKNDSSVLLQNFTDRDDKNSGRGQILGQISQKHSALIIWQGLSGRVINSYSDVALQDVYYIRPDELAAMYVASKFQVANLKRLDELAAANQGWKAFNIPLDHQRPYDARV
jgi:hypothetical protein